MFEDVVTARAVPRDFAVEDQFICGDGRDRALDSGNVLQQAIARIELHLAAALIGEQADAVELALEQPVRAGEAFWVRVSRPSARATRASASSSTLAELRRPVTYP
jgi:hypothetical protein